MAWDSLEDPLQGLTDGDYYTLTDSGATVGINVAARDYYPHEVTIDIFHQQSGNLIDSKYVGDARGGIYYC